MPELVCFYTPHSGMMYAGGVVWYPGLAASSLRLLRCLTGAQIKCATLGAHQRWQCTQSMCSLVVAASGYNPPGWLSLIVSRKHVLLRPLIVVVVVGAQHACHHQAGIHMCDSTGARADHKCLDTCIYAEGKQCMCSNDGPCCSCRVCLEDAMMRGHWHWQGTTGADIFRAV
jgi:hypothetical protein